MHSHPQAAASNSYERCFQVINQSKHKRMTRRHMSRLVSSLPFGFPLSSALKNLLLKLPINRREPVINDFRDESQNYIGCKKRSKGRQRNVSGDSRNAAERGPNSIFIRKPITTAGNKIPLVNPLSSPQRRTKERILPKSHSISRVRNLNSIYHGWSLLQSPYIIRPALRVSAAAGLHRFTGSNRTRARHRSMV